ncbi:hypothetical protein V865_001145 [Kwoniella europaea PYCC6329]|uniref:Uncharacterized protein n=1 Tax=Kwoniella europaea PYCC6329 TaxID=1423913 RepID=A0AAX4KCB5_9TREE
MHLISLLTTLTLLVPTFSLPMNLNEPWMIDDQDGGVRTVRDFPEPTPTSDGQAANIEATPLFTPTYTKARYYWPLTTLRIPISVDIGRVIPTIPPKPEWPVPDPGPRPEFEIGENGIVIGS